MGIVIWTDDDTYYGQIKYNKRDGYGIYKYFDNSIHISHYKNNELHGLAKYKPEDLVDFIKYSLYEDGEEIKTFTLEEVS